VNNTKRTVSIKVQRKVTQPDFRGDLKNTYATKNKAACPLYLDPRDMFNPGTTPES
jgi:hypothetical protein